MVLTERKPKFRARKLDFSRPLQILRYDQATDLDDYGSPLRTVTQVATGVDKDEEDEHHLKVALTAAATQSQTYYIPTPESHPAPTDHEELYPKTFKAPKQFIKWSGKTLEDVFSDVSKYDADVEDEAFAKTLKVDLNIFEMIMEAFEDCAHKLSPNIVSLNVLDRLKTENRKKMPEDSICQKILEYWNQKRTVVGRGLIPILKHEDLTAKIGADPYVCFRRREIKAPRKTRRTDAQCMDKLKRLHYDLATSKALIEASLKRDRYKRECMLLETSLFENYWALEVWKKQPGRNTEWALPDVPLFRAAAQSVLEPKKKRPKPSSSTANADNASQSSAAPARSAASSHAILKSSKYHKPYYTIEVLRQIQKDMEVVMVDEATRLQDTTGDLSSDDDNSSFTDSRALPEITAGLPCFSRFRLGRGGLVQIDRKPIRDESESRPRLIYNSASRIKSLNARDCSHLHNAFVGNYNQHYIQTTNHISQPLSYNAWIAATAPIIQAAVAPAKTGGTSSKPGASPKKNGLSRAASISEMDPTAAAKPPETAEAPTSSQPPTGLAALAGNSQFTINVKPKPQP